MTVETEISLAVDEMLR